jgi:hypothetical protein
MKRQQEQGQREEDIDASGAAPARESQDVQEGASGGEAVGERAEATRGADATQGSVSNAATDATSSLAAAAAGTGKTVEMQQGEGEGKGEEEEDNVARVLRLGAQPDGVDAEDAAWIATIIEQALELLDHAGARAALSAIRSTLTAGHGDYVRLVCGSKASSGGGGGGGGGASDSEGKEGKGDTGAVAAVAAAAAEQLGGATASKRGRGGRVGGRGRGRPRGSSSSSSSSSSRAAGGRKDKDEEVYYPAGCVVDGDTGVLLST